MLATSNKESSTSAQAVAKRTSFNPAEVQGSVEAIHEFVSQPGFVNALAELYALPVEERPTFVVDVLLNTDEMAKRGVHAPEDLIVQRSVFEDGRPTLFCVTKYLSDRQRKVTITFDDPMSKEDLEKLSKARGRAFQQ